MRKIKIMVESNDNDVTNRLVALLRAAKTNTNYELDIQAEYPFEFKKPIDRPHLSRPPVYCTNFHYYFVDKTANSALQDFDALRAFALEYEREVSGLMMVSGEFKDRFTSDNLRVLRAHQAGMDELINVDRQVLQLGEFQTPTRSAPHYHPTMFSPNIDTKTPRVNGRNATIALVSGAIMGIISIPLFFVEPISASAIAALALLLFAMAIYFGVKSCCQSSPENAVTPRIA